MLDDTTESVAAHILNLQPSILCMPLLQSLCLVVLVPNFTTQGQGCRLGLALR